MNSLRLLIVTRKFWPVSGPAETEVGDLACALRSLGHQVEVVTARWGKNWPARFVIREVPVRRITRPTAGPWGSFRFQRALTRLIAQSFDDGLPFDGMIIFGLGQETEHVLRWLETRNAATKVVARVSPDINPYHLWSQNTIRRTLFSLDHVHAIAADSELTKRQLVRFNVKSDIVHVICSGVGEPETDLQAPSDNPLNRSKASQISARRALSDAHPILTIEPEQPLVVSATSMEGDNGLIDLVDAWSTVILSYPRARLWLLGDGSRGQQVWDAITSRELVHSIIMPGYFDDVSQVFAAADLYVHPHRSDAACSGLIKAMACGLCPIATLGEFTEKLVKKNATGILTVSGNSKALAEAVLHGLENTDLRTRLGTEASRCIRRELPIVEQAKRFVKLMSKQAAPLVQKSSLEPPHPVRR
jgi:glycosyltransferase involved in cell wall biosynthesis